jgi:hypothetical protein
MKSSLSHPCIENWMHTQTNADRKASSLSVYKIFPILLFFSVHFFSSFSFYCSIVLIVINVCPWTFFSIFFTKKNLQVEIEENDERKWKTIFLVLFVFLKALVWRFFLFSRGFSVPDIKREIITFALFAVFNNRLYLLQQQSLFLFWQLTQKVGSENSIVKY